MSIPEKKIQEVKQRFGIVGHSALLQRSIEMAIKVAPTDLSVLITGESGVGKEAFSHIIHSLSKRKHNNFIAINCGAIPEGTIDSELFGHEKGAFTTALESRKGYFETANGGTIFLDEIGELPFETQSRLLRVLESGEFIKVGSSKAQKTDVRVITATNKDLTEALKNKKFRDDLYYRLSTVTIKIPTLKERKEDIMMLFAKFASDFADKHNIPPVELTPEAEEMLSHYNWPGNIRQLKNFVEEISVLETDRTVDPETVQQYLPEEPSRELKQFNTDSNEGTNFQERELLYKFLFDLKQDVSDLKNMMYQFFKEINQQQQETGFNQQQEDQALNRLLDAGKTKEEAPTFKESNEEQDYNMKAEVKSEDERVLSLQDQEKDMIKKALSKYKGKRKAAAKELGISERTLYRKIKEYNLEAV